MDPELSETISKLKSEKRIFANKLLELSKFVKHTFAKIEKKMDDRFAFYDEKISTLIHLNEGLQNRVEQSEKMTTVEATKNKDNFNELETAFEKESKDIEDVKDQQSKIDVLIGKIDDKLDNLNQRIVETVSNIENLERKEIESEKKQCIHDRKGYCKNGNSCPFFHTNEICKEYIVNKICTKLQCRKRHPQRCRYFLKTICRRGDTCRYLHIKPTETEKCHRCQNLAKQRYYCEFCRRNFCSSCTIGEAHVKNIYNPEEHSNQCLSIHKI